MTDGLPSSRLTAAFERRVARVLGASVPAAEPVVVACSGGPDSTAVLVAVVRGRARQAGAGPVTAATFDHGVRAVEETEADRAAVEALCARLGVAFRHGVARGRVASEADAREVRYRWLASVCARLEVRSCVTGHTLDDQAETVLLRVTRGAGLHGVAGMEPVASWPVACDGAELRVVRPLLGVRRAEAARYLRELGVEARLDATNELVTFSRNRIRHRVLPELRSINPRVDDALTRFAALARRDEEALEVWSRREYGRIATAGADQAALARNELRALPPAVAARVLRLAARTLGIDLDGGQVDELLRLVGRRGASLSLAGGRAHVTADEVVLERAGGTRS